MELDQYAVMGCPIQHSLSPKIHAMFAQQTSELLIYSTIEVKPEYFAQAVQEFRAAGGKGLNITVPLKEVAYEFVANQISEAAEEAGAVNTISIPETGPCFGDNTDGVGFIRDVYQNYKRTFKQQRVLILGAGGAVRGILGPVLKCQPEQIVIANRTLEKAQLLQKKINHDGIVLATDFDSLGKAPWRNFDWIIHGTSMGLTGQLLQLPENLMSSNCCCYDLQYNRKELTPFLAWAQQQVGEKVIVDGLGMLVEQAAESFHIWRGVSPQTQSVIDSLRQTN